MEILNSLKKVTDLMEKMFSDVPLTEDELSPENVIPACDLALRKLKGIPLNFATDLETDSEDLFQAPDHSSASMRVYEGIFKPHDPDEPISARVLALDPGPSITKNQIKNRDWYVADSEDDDSSDFGGFSGDSDDDSDSPSSGVPPNSPSNVVPPNSPSSVVPPNSQITDTNSGGNDHNDQNDNVSNNNGGGHVDPNDDGFPIDVNPVVVDSPIPTRRLPKIDVAKGRKKRRARKVRPISPIHPPIRPTPPMDSPELPRVSRSLSPIVEEDENEDERGHFHGNEDRFNTGGLFPGGLGPGGLRPRGVTPGGLTTRGFTTGGLTPGGNFQIVRPFRYEADAHEEIQRIVNDVLLGKSPAEVFERNTLSECKAVFALFCKMLDADLFDITLNDDNEIETIIVLEPTVE